MRRARAAIVPRGEVTAAALPGGAVVLSFELPPPPRTSDVLPPACARVVELAVQGLSDREIARRLDRSPHTVSNLLRAAYRRLGVQGRFELAAALARGPAPPARRRRGP